MVGQHAQRSIVEDEEGADTRCIRLHRLELLFNSIDCVAIVIDPVASDTVTYHVVLRHLSSSLLSGVSPSRFPVHDNRHVLTTGMVTCPQNYLPI